MDKKKGALEDTRGGQSCKSCESASVSHGQRDTTLLLDLPTSACLAEIVKRVAIKVWHFVIERILMSHAWYCFHDQNEALVDVKTNCPVKTVVPAIHNLAPGHSGLDHHF